MYTSIGEKHKMVNFIDCCGVFRNGIVRLIPNICAHNATLLSPHNSEVGALLLLSELIVFTMKLMQFCLQRGMGTNIIGLYRLQKYQQHRQNRVYCPKFRWPCKSAVFLFLSKSVLERDKTVDWKSACMERKWGRSWCKGESLSKSIQVFAFENNSPERICKHWFEKISHSYSLCM